MADYPQIPKIRKPSRGRQKIEIKKIEQTNSRQVSFSKRKAGLFKKASELAVLCGADVAVIVMSERERAFSFGHPNADFVLNRFLSNGNYAKENSIIASSHPHDPLELNKQYEDALKKLEEEKIKGAMIKQGIEDFGEFFWWNLPIENMEVDQFKDYMEFLHELKHIIVARMNHLNSFNPPPLAILEPMLEGNNLNLTNEFNNYSFNPPPLATVEPMSGNNNLAPIMESTPPDFGGNAAQLGFENYFPE